MIQPDQSLPLLAARKLSVRYATSSASSRKSAGIVRAVEEVYLNLYAGETLGIVGESGCGKSTLARALIGLEPVAEGAITYRGKDIGRLSEKQWRPLRRDIQMVFQDPISSLDPRMTIGRIISEPLDALCSDMSRQERSERVLETMERVGLSRELVNRYPHEFSGGQSQRVGIARALVVRPKILICDEPVSALDVSVQAQVINLLRDLQREYGLALLFIAHDLAVVRHISHRVMVMYLGRVMETAEAEALFRQPAHPYTRALLASVPSASKPGELAVRLLEGELPDPSDPPSGCVFRTRCPIADSHCGAQVPTSRQTPSGGFASCHYVAAEAKQKVLQFPRSLS